MTDVQNSLKTGIKEWLITHPGGEYAIHLTNLYSTRKRNERILAIPCFYKEINKLKQNLPLQGCVHIPLDHNHDTLGAHKSPPTPWQRITLIELLMHSCTCHDVLVDVLIG